MTWWDEEYRRRMRARGYEPTMDGMDDQDVKDALEGMDRRNAARQQGEWQYPRYKQPDPGFVARIMRMFGQPYDKSAIDPKEAHYLNGWDNGDDNDDDDAPPAKPVQNLFQPSRGGGRQTDGQWKLNWSGTTNVLGAQPQAFQYRPRQDVPMATGRGKSGRPSFGPSGHDVGVHMKGGDNNPYAGGYVDGGALSGSTAQGQVNVLKSRPPQIAGGDHLGYLSAGKESDNNPGEISPGDGDDGGKSYGAFQFASKRGVPGEFLKWLATNNPDVYTRLQAAREADGQDHGPKFDATWRQIALENPDGFLKMQYDFSKQKYYDPAVAAIKEQTGFDFNGKSYALKNVLWSRSVHHGDTGVINVIKNALKYVDLNNENEEEIIKAIYKESGSTDSKEGPFITEEGIRNRLSPEKAEELISFAREHTLSGNH